jgi:hypothetical protein
MVQAIKVLHISDRVIISYYKCEYIGFFMRKDGPVARHEIVHMGYAD